MARVIPVVRPRAQETRGLAPADATETKKQPLIGEAQNRRRFDKNNDNEEQGDRHCSIILPVLSTPPCYGEWFGSLSLRSPLASWGVLVTLLGVSLSYKSTVITWTFSTKLQYIMFQNGTWYSIFCPSLLLSFLLSHYPNPSENDYRGVPSFE